MKYLLQFFLIGVFYYLGELLHSVIPLPVPAAVYGLVLLFTALCTGILKLEHVEKAADFLLAIMSLMFIPPAVGIVNLLDILADTWWKIIIVCVVTTFTTIAITGHTAQALVRLRQRIASLRPQHGVRK
ncbi:MAG: CidA/LrgA family protein [Clostridiaceae bacterium]|nr:CidA/LrgA family protein [Clostridiaceae bacterium]